MENTSQDYTASVNASDSHNPTKKVGKKPVSSASSAPDAALFDELPKRTDRPQRRRRSRLSVHPLFLLFGVYYCFIGELPMFLLSALVALQHECAHAFAAARLGYSLDRVVLMPYGAVIDGDLSGISFKDEIFVAVWGPLCNLCTAAAFAALWWMYPAAYAFTDTACFVSLAVALVNLVPAYPLDGGRVLRCALCLHMPEKKADKICRGITVAAALALLSAFVALCVRRTPNFTLLAFALFLGAGAFGNTKSEAAKYTKINFSSKDAFRRGVEIRRVAVTEDCTLKRAVGFVTQDKYLILDVYDKNEKYIGEIRQNELAEIFFSSGIYRTLGEFM